MEVEGPCQSITRSPVLTLPTMLFLLCGGNGEEAIEKRWGGSQIHGEITGEGEELRYRKFQGQKTKALNLMFKHQVN